jgi:hypothetical protein
VEKKTRLTYRNILRKEEDGEKDECYNGVAAFKNGTTPVGFVPYSPPKPAPHPIDREKFERWKLNALRANPGGESDIEEFALGLRHISVDQFRAALRACFAQVYQTWPKSECTHVLLNTLENYSRLGEQKGNSRSWMAELVNHMGLYDIPEQRDMTHVRFKDGKRVLRIKLDDAMYSGGSFVNDYIDSQFDVFVVPFTLNIKTVASALFAYPRSAPGKVYYLNAKDGNLYHAVRVECRTGLSYSWRQRSLKPLYAPSS